MIFAYKVMKGKMNIRREDFFKLQTNVGTRGHGYKILKQRATKMSRNNTFSQRIVNDWNSLSRKVVESPSVDSFKMNLDEYWSNKLYETPYSQD